MDALSKRFTGLGSRFYGLGLQRMSPFLAGRKNTDLIFGVHEGYLELREYFQPDMPSIHLLTSLYGVVIKLKKDIFATYCNSRESSDFLGYKDSSMKNNLPVRPNP